VGTIKEIKGHCAQGHQVGDRFELEVHRTADLCGFFYHDLFPYIMMLQFGGGFPAEWGDPDVVTVRCTDIANAVTIELKRMR
jgi:uncharacterized repeat protein (TIGR04076 family)